MLSSSNKGSDEFGIEMNVKNKFVILLSMVIDMFDGGCVAIVAGTILLGRQIELKTNHSVTIQITIDTNAAVITIIGIGFNIFSKIFQIFFRP